MLVVTNRLPMQETQEIRSLGREDPLEEEMAAHSSVLAWRIPWTEEPGGLQSVGSQESRTRLKRLSTRAEGQSLVDGCSWRLRSRILSAWSNTASCEIQLRRGYPTALAGNTPDLCLWSIYLTPLLFSLSLTMPQHTLWIIFLKPNYIHTPLVRKCQFMNR